MRLIRASCGTLSKALIISTKTRSTGCRQSSDFVIIIPTGRIAYFAVSPFRNKCRVSANLAASLVEPPNYHRSIKLTNHIEAKYRPVCGRHTTRSLTLIYWMIVASTRARGIFCFSVQHLLKSFSSRLCSHLPPYTISSGCIPLVHGAMCRLSLAKCSLNSSLVNSGSFLVSLVL